MTWKTMENWPRGVLGAGTSPRLFLHNKQIPPALSFTSKTSKPSIHKGSSPNQGQVLTCSKKGVNGA